MKFDQQIKILEQEIFKPADYTDIKNRHEIYYDKIRKDIENNYNNGKRIEIGNYIKRIWYKKSYSGIDIISYFKILDIFENPKKNEPIIAYQLQYTIDILNKTISEYKIDSTIDKYSITLSHINSAYDNAILFSTFSSFSGYNNLYLQFNDNKQVIDEINKYKKDNFEILSLNEGIFQRVLSSLLLGTSMSLSTMNTADAKNIKPSIHKIADKKVDVNKIIPALIVVESGNNSNAIGDNGKAFGILQLHKDYIDDVNRIYGTSYVHNDAFDPIKAKDITRLYLTYWGNKYVKDTKKPLTYDVLARLHNGGFDGWKDKGTIEYAKKVLKQLKKMKIV